MATTQNGTEVLSVSAALNRAQKALQDLPLVIEGEVSEVNNKPGYKAVYFTVKDQNSCLPCMMWRNKYAASGVQLKVGSLVRMRGKLSIYAPKGRMSFDVSNLYLSGEGELRLKIAMLARKLRDEGLTDPARKRPLPEYPEVIGLVTSPRGDAVHDVLRTLRRRYPAARVVFSGVPVEGVGAPQNVITGLKALVEAGAEVCLVVRGGGSLEDLMPFNDEALARAIASCPVPVVTGIGHEPDTTIADLVADFRASTPTGAAQAVSPGEGALDELLEQSMKTLSARMMQELSTCKLRLQAKAERPCFTDSTTLLSQEMMGLDLASMRLNHAIPANVRRDDEVLSRYGEKLLLWPQKELEAKSRVIQHASELLNRSETVVSQQFEGSLSRAAALLNSLSPLAVLGRGYAITYGPQGNVIKNAQELSAGDNITVALHKGKLNCSVTNVID